MARTLDRVVEQAVKLPTESRAWLATKMLDQHIEVTPAWGQWEAPRMLRCSTPHVTVAARRRCEARGSGDTANVADYELDLAVRSIAAGRCVGRASPWLLWAVHQGQCGTRPSRDVEHLQAVQSVVFNPSMEAKSLSRVTRVAPRADAVAAIQRSFSSRLTPCCSRVRLIFA